MSDTDIIVTIIMGGCVTGIVLMGMWAVENKTKLEKIYLYMYLSAFAVGVAGFACAFIREIF